MVIEEPRVAPRTPDDADEARPGRDHEPPTAPRVPVRDEGDHRGIDSPDHPDRARDLDAMAPDGGH